MHWLLEAVFSFVSVRSCIACAREPSSRRLSSPFVCEPCRNSILTSPSLSCSGCGAPLPEPSVEYCGPCLVTPSPFRSVNSAFVYGGPVQDAILRWKCPSSGGEGARELIQLAKEMKRIPELSVDQILPVPPHPQNQRKRDFYPTYDLAKSLSREMPLHPQVRDLLHFTKSGLKSQKSRGTKDRKRALSLRVNHPDWIRDKDILLVDDVRTTGSTSLGCARALIKAGVRSVSLWTLARTNLHHEGF